MRLKDKARSKQERRAQRKVAKTNGDGETSPDMPEGFDENGVAIEGSNGNGATPPMALVNGNGGAPAPTATTPAAPQAAPPPEAVTATPSSIPHRVVARRVPMVPSRRQP
jgi:hypothetical protein